MPIQKTYTCNPQEYDYLDRAQNKLRVPMHYVLKNDKAHQLGTAALPFGKVRIFIEGAGPDAQANTAFLGEDWGKFTPRDDEMRLYLGVAQDIVVKRTIEKHETKQITGNLYNHEVVVKYEIENFKKQPVTLDVAENLRYLRNEVRGDTGATSTGSSAATPRSPTDRTRSAARSSNLSFTRRCRRPALPARPRPSFIVYTSP